MERNDKSHAAQRSDESAARPLILADIGNSQVKLGWCRAGRARGGDELVGSIQLLAQLSPAQLERGGAQVPIQLPDDPARWLVISVAPKVLARLRGWVEAHRPNDEWTELGYRDLPLKLAVEHPERVGLDRLAAAVGANELRGAGRAAIVIDAGTAITVDAVDAAGAFLGGLILPGPRIAARSLAVNTAQLPDVMFDPADVPALIGTNTVDAIRGGIYWGLLGALELLIERLKDRLGADTEVFVTGGAMDSWSARLSAPVRQVPDLVLIGIARSRPSSS